MPVNLNASEREAISLVAAEPYDLINFPKSKDQIFNQCLSKYRSEKVKSDSICKNQGYGTYWICPKGLKLRLDSINQCQSSYEKVSEKNAYLYLLGLLHRDQNFQTDPRTRYCPEYYRYQEGSAVCVYTNMHFEELKSDFPKSKYADMATYNLAKKAYRYYECEGQVLCRITNEITGWIAYLKERPISTYSDLAVDKIVSSLENIKTTKFSKGESPSYFLSDYKTLAKISEQVTLQNSKKLTTIMSDTRPILLKLEVELNEYRQKRQK